MSKKLIKKIIVLLPIFFTTILVSLYILLIKKEGGYSQENNSEKQTENKTALELSVGGKVPPVSQGALPPGKKFLIDFEVPTEKEIMISDVTVPNFYLSGPEPGKIGDIVIVDKPEYKIIYYPLDEGFLIPILASPFEKHKTLAEEDLITMLKISKEDACKLLVSITTPEIVNPSEAGTNWGISWCE